MYIKSHVKTAGRYVIPLLICSISLSICHASDDLKAKEQALKIIENFADSFCKEVNLEGGDRSIVLSGEVKAELNGIIKKIADLGIEGAAKYQKKEYQGLLQKDLIEGYKSNTECRMHIWSDLNDKFLGYSPDTSNQNEIKQGEQSTSGEKSPIISNTKGNVNVTY